MTTDTVEYQPHQTVLLSLPSTLRIADIGEFKKECDAALETAHHAALACDASAVEFIDASALQYLVALSRHCASATTEFEIRSPSAAFASAVAASGYAAPLGFAATPQM